MFPLARAQASLPDCVTGVDAPAFFDGTCGMKDEHACTFDASEGTLVCDLELFSSSCAVPGDPSIYAVNYQGSTHVSIFGTCADALDPSEELTFCCVVQQDARNVVRSVSLFGTEHAEEIMAFHHADSGSDLVPVFGAMTASIQARGGNDNLVGSNADTAQYSETLYGGDGVDAVLGGDGDDVLHGGHGQDYLSGGPGKDTLHGDQGNDDLWGGPGNDTLWGGSHNDTLHGDDGEDVLYGQSGNDWLYGGDNRDILWGQNGLDQLFGQQGDDVLSGGANADVLDGGADNDKMSGNYGNDTLYGRDGIDWIYGGRGADTIEAGAGDDVICEDQAPNPSAPTLAVNTISGGDDHDVLYHDIVQTNGDPAEMLGDKTVEAVHATAGAAPDNVLVPFGGTHYSPYVFAPECEYLQRELAN
jgi:Ca2+-binding RTX toxin-like protein